jgi:hypothetical protein
VTSMNTYELLRLLLLGGFAGFVVFSISYGFVVWSRRNKGAGAGRKHALASVAPVVAVIGVVASASGIVQAKLVTYTGLIESSINTPNRADLEARARLGALSTVPLKIDPALTLRQSQLRTQIDQLSRFQFDLGTARREIDRDNDKLNSTYASEVAAIGSELQVAEAALSGYPARIDVAEKQLGRALELLRRGTFSEVPVDQRKLELLTLKDGNARTIATIAAAHKREAVATERYKQTAQLYETQLAEIQKREDEYAEEITAQRMKLATVERLIAEDGEAALAAMSSGRGFSVKVTVPATELAALKQVKSITFEPRNLPIRSKFSGTFESSVPLEASPTMVIASFDVRLPSDVLTQLKTSSDPVLVDAYWNPPIAQSNLVQAGSGITGIAVLIWLFGSLLGRSRRAKEEKEEEARPRDASEIPLNAAVVRHLRRV